MKEPARLELPILGGLELGFEREDGARLSLAWPDLYWLDLAAVLAGVRTLSYTHMSELSGEPQRLAAFFGLACRVERRGDESRGSAVSVFFARDKKEVAAAVKLWRGQKEDRLFELLGYPACCVAFHQEWLEGGGGDLIPRILANTRSRSPFSFRLNDALFEMGRGSRLGRWQKRLPPLRLLPWHPCAYDCAASLKAGRRIWAWLSAAHPAFAACLEGGLRRVVLYFDGGGCVLLEGRLTSPRECVYAAVSHAALVEDEGVRQAFARGDRVSLGPEGARISRGKKLLAALPCSQPLLLDFTGA